jgi:hypothetical protein
MDHNSRVGTGKLGRALKEVHGDDDSYRVVRGLAQALHHDYQLAGPPFVLQSLAAALGIDVTEEDIEAEGAFRVTALHSLNEVEREEGSLAPPCPKGISFHPSLMRRLVSFCEKSSRARAFRPFAAVTSRWPMRSATS